jgi:hypothetical protein
MKNSKSVDEIFAEFNERVRLGQDFSGRGSIDSLDLLDFYKKELCKKISEIHKTHGSDEHHSLTMTKASGLIELRAALRFRTERLTAERLAEMLASAMGDDNLLKNMKQNILYTVLKSSTFLKVPMNDSIRGLLSNRNTEITSLDFLISILDKIRLLDGLLVDKIDRKAVS